MSPLTANQEDFVGRMCRGEEVHGFALLAQRGDGDIFFDALIREGVFARDKSPGVVENGQYYRFPYWPATAYLESMAKMAGENNDMGLAGKIMHIVRDVGSVEKDKRNPYTFQSFAKILGLLPTTAVQEKDLDLVPGWLDMWVMSDLVRSTLLQDVLPRFLSSSRKEDLGKAVVILKHCTELYEVEGDGVSRREFVSRVSDFWLNHPLDRHVIGELGEKCGKDTTDLFLARLRQFYKVPGEKEDLSWISRPAVEENAQNVIRSGPLPFLISGLRDALLAWSGRDIEGSALFVRGLLGDTIQIARRIGIYILNQRWKEMGDKFRDIWTPALFDRGHLHELYTFLDQRFGEFAEGEKGAVLEVLKKIPLPRDQRHWIQALVGKGYEPANIWSNELSESPGTPPPPDHPEFLAYMETRTGFGPSPFTPEEIRVFLKDGVLVERLNEFEPGDPWEGPTTRALVDTLREAVHNHPAEFVPKLTDFLRAKRPYQYGLIWGLKRAWEGAKEGGKDKDFWDNTWDKLMTFFEELLRPMSFWEESVEKDDSTTPNRDWIPPEVGDFLRSGTHSDEWAYPASLLPRGRVLIQRLLEHSQMEEAMDDLSDPMNRVINTKKGRVIEALFSHALRECRSADKEGDGHDRVWSDLRPIFDKEVKLCQNANFEFSTLIGAYIVHAAYLDERWLRENILQLFPAEHAVNRLCFISGMAHAPPSRNVYEILVGNNIVDDALRLEIKGEAVRDQLVRRIGVAYLKGGESLDSSRMTYLFNSSWVSDLRRMVDLFWELRDKGLSDADKGKIMAFWDKCAETPNLSPDFLSSLGRLSCYIHSIGERERGLLLMSAPHVHRAFGFEFFVEDLIRLTRENASAVSQVLEKALDAQIPSFDYKDRLKTLLRALYNAGQRQEAITFTDKLRDLPGMLGLFQELSSPS
jgi:hypothetical protein